MRRSIFKLRGRAAERAAAGVAIAVALGAVLAWVFTQPSQKSLPESIWRLVLSDSVTLGFVRAAIVMLAVYAIGSMAALLAGGRWIRAIGRGGLEMDAARSAEERIAELAGRLQEAEARRNQAVRLLDVFLHG